MRGQDLIYGHIEMEIILKLDCGLDVDFEPDWVSTENCADYNKVQWQLSDSPDKGSVDDVFCIFSKEQSLPSTRNSLESLRLLRRRDS